MDQITEKQKILEELIDYLVKEGNSQSMSEDFHDGYETAIFLIQKYGKLEQKKNIKPHKPAPWEIKK